MNWNGKMRPECIRRWISWESMNEGQIFARNISLYIDIIMECACSLLSTKIDARTYIMSKEKRTWCEPNKIINKQKKKKKYDENTARWAKYGFDHQQFEIDDEDCLSAVASVTIPYLQNKRVRRCSRKSHTLLNDWISNGSPNREVAHSLIIVSVFQLFC